jgi:hypothetical protein
MIPCTHARSIHQSYETESDGSLRLGRRELRNPTNKSRPRSDPITLKEPSLAKSVCVLPDAVAVTLRDDARNRDVGSLVAGARNDWLHRVSTRAVS